MMKSFLYITGTDIQYKLSILGITQILGLGIGCNFIIDNQLQPTDRLSIIISSSHSFGNWVQA